jgi:VCBS repeat-containing protein
VNDAPVASDASVTTAEDTPLVVDPRGYASDVDSTVFATQIVSGPSHGTLVQNADGSYTYTAGLNYNGPDSFTYRVSDGELDSNIATVSITVTAVNDAPVAADDTASTAEDTPVTVPVQGNDVDVDSASLQTVLVAGPQHGTVVLNADGSFTYTAALDYNGADSFTYKVSDGELESNIATVNLTITPVNDAPVVADAAVSTAEDTPLVVDPRGYASDVDSTVFTTQIVSGPAHGTLVQNADGSYTYTAELNYNGPDSFTYRVSDGELDSNVATVNISVTPVNDAPVAADSAVTGSEDEPYLFTWADFAVSDVETAALQLVITSLPLDGLLQYYDGTAWLAVAVGQAISRADIEAGYLCFGPDANESGIDGYGGTGVGNLQRDYANFTYQVSDGDLLSNQATLTIDLAPRADTPGLVLIDPPDENGDSRERFNTSWETAPNRNRNFTLLPYTNLEGWRALTEDGCGGDDGFVIWSSGDRMKDANNNLRTVYAAPDNGNNWLELGDSGVNHQGYGIERLVRTRTQATYTLSFDYAGRLGYDAEHTRIAVYLDNTLVGTYANTSPNTSLNWQEVSFQFTGDGTLQALRIQMDGPSGNHWDERGAMIDGIKLVEELPLNTGYSNDPIRLSAIVAALVDTDGSEALAVTVGAIPAGAVLTDGVNTFTASAASSVADVTVWNLDNLHITAPQDFIGVFDLTITATATEGLTGETATKGDTLTVTVLNSNISSPLVLDLDGNGVETVSIDGSTATFDLLNTGEAVRSGWISEGDAFLAVDTNGNGIVDDRSELFGGAIGEGFAKLAKFDDNMDGRVDAADARFSELLLWADVNGNHRTDMGELSTLAARGVASLSTRYVMAPEEQNGNWLLEHGTATFSDGRVVELVDAYFRTDTPKADITADARGATITVRSEMASVRSSKLQVFAGGAVFDWPKGGAAVPQINWTGLPPTPEEGLMAIDEARKKKASIKSWLTDFLGIGSAGGAQRLWERTGLKVVLGDSVESNLGKGDSMK